MQVQYRASTPSLADNVTSSLRIAVTKTSFPIMHEQKLLKCFIDEDLFVKECKKHVWGEKSYSNLISNYFLMTEQ